MSNYTFDSLYTPKIESPTFGDKLSDSILGTNNLDFLNQKNQWEYWKSANINKYSYNVQGMLQAGINPLLNTNGLNNSTTSPISTQFNNNLGILGNTISKTANNLLSHFVPQSKEDKLNLLKSLLGFFH